MSIVSHDNVDDLKRLIPSLKKDIEFFKYEILIVENKANQGTLEFIENEHPDIELTINKTPMGYGANHNQNLKRAKGKYTVLMNPDIVIRPGAFARLLKFMEANSDVGICSPNVLNQDGSLQYLNKEYPTVLDLFLRRFIPGFLNRGAIKARMDYYEMRGTGYCSPVDIPFISGCFMFCRTSILKSVTGFDEGYYMYFEDADLCRRIQQHARTVSCPGAKVIHRWERASHKNMHWFLVFIKSAIRYFNKWGYQLI